MKNAAKRKCPFELSFHGFTSQKRGSVKAASVHTGSPSTRLGGKFSRERTASRRGLSVELCCVSDGRASEAPGGKHLERGREKGGAGGRGSREESGGATSFLYYPVHLPSFL